eukprot:8962125-Karenia_brevis.AAC.1
MQVVPEKVKDELRSALCLLPLARTELCLPFDEVVSCSDASLHGGAFCHTTGLTKMGRLELAR